MRRSKRKERHLRSSGLRPFHKLPEADLQGRFLFSISAIAAAERLLPTYRGPDGDHEGIVFLLGRELPNITLITAALAPVADHSPGRVLCEPEAISAAQTAAREYGLGLLAQVHTHPGDLTEHSEGDDDLVLMPFEGMLSLVVPRYCHFGMRPLSGLGIHQFQSGRWVAIRPDTAREGLQVVPGEIDLR
jgi:JAB domain-containing protein similar to deubiquitination enzymes